MKRGERIEKRIVEYLREENKLASTREIALVLNLAWHTANTHCLKLQLQGKLEFTKIGNMNVWRLIEEKGEE